MPCRQIYLHDLPPSQQQWPAALPRILARRNGQYRYYVLEAICRGARTIEEAGGLITYIDRLQERKVTRASLNGILEQIVRGSHIC